MSLPTTDHDVANTPAQLLGRYIVGGILGHVAERGVEIRTIEQIVTINDDSVVARCDYAQNRPHRWAVGHRRSRVRRGLGLIATDELKYEMPDIHILGDVYAPRRLVFATRQADALAETMVHN
jgi:hypothetical protein